MNVLLGIDSGTSSTKGIACLADGTVLAEARAEHGISMPRPGHAEQDADGVWWHDLVEVARRLVAALPAGSTIAGIGVSTAGPCLVPVDERDRALRPGILYGIDTRATAQIAALELRIGRRAIRRLSGSGLTSQSVGPKIAWLRDHEPDVARRTACYLTAGGYLGLRLTGESVIDHHQASYFAPFFDLGRGRWDLRHADGLVEEAQLPRILWSDEIIGTVHTAAAAETGIPTGTPVVAGSTDGIAEALGVGVVDPGDLAITYGSSSVAMLVLDRPRSGANLWPSAGAFPGSAVLAGGGSTTGAVTAWFRRELARELVQADAVTIGEAHATLLGEAARSSPGAHGLLLLPYFSGERSPIADDRARGVFAGLGLGHTRGDLYRAVLEATGFALRHTIEALRATNAPIRRAVAVGGGAASALLPRIVSDIVGIPQLIPAVRHGAAYGDAWLAGVGTGLIGDPASPASRWVGPSASVDPEPANARRYDELYGLYRSLYRATAPTVHALVALDARSGDGGSEGAAAPAESGATT